MLKDSEWSKFSNNQIAKTCSVSHTFVNKLRSSLETVSSENISSISEESLETNSSERNLNKHRTYTTKHGTTSTMDTSNIGKTPKVELAEGIKVKIQDNSPISPGLKGEITSLPNSSSAIVLFEDGTREMVDREYIKPALEELPQSLILRSTRVNSPPNPKVQATEKETEEGRAENNLKTDSSSSSSSKNEPTSRKEELDQKQEELGLGKRRQSVLPESDRIDELQHSNPTGVDDRPFANPPIEPLNPKTVINNLAIHAENLGKDDYRSIGKIITNSKPEAIKDVAEMMADTEEKALAILETITSKYPKLLSEF